MSTRLHFYFYIFIDILIIAIYNINMIILYTHLFLMGEYYMNRTTLFSHISGKWLVFLGALFWSLNAPLIKYLTINPLLICGLRALIAGIVLSPFIRLKKFRFTPWLITYMISYSTLCIGIVIALQYTSAPIAIGMQYSSIIWIFIVHAIISKKFSFKKFSPVFLIILGVFCFMLSGFQDGTSFGNLIALTEGISFALMTVSFQKSSIENPIGITAMANLFCSFFVFLCCPKIINDITLISISEWLILLLLGIVQVGLGYTFYNLGIQKTSAQSAAIISLWEMILGPVWIAIFYHEYPSALVFSGFVIILCGMLFHVYLENKKTS